MEDFPQTEKSPIQRPVSGGANPSSDRRLNQLLDSVLNEVKRYAGDQSQHIAQLTRIGISLSAEKNLGRLLEMIVDDARAFSNADAGTLYILDKKAMHLRFEILQNDTMKTRLGGTSGQEIKLPPVPLYRDGRPNHANVSSHVALTGETVNIEDVYEAEGFDFTGPRKYDTATGYRSKSMLVIPMRNHENEIIGVLQLLNAMDPETGEVVEFSAGYVDLIASLASQAAVALTNAQLIQDLKNLFYAFIKSIATAIDEKSPYTGGHISRVVELTMMLADKINHTTEGPFKDIRFTDDELEELRIAAWMHDVGKITTPEHVVDKSTKLETIFDRVQLVETRFQLIAQSIETHYLKKKLDVLRDGLRNEARIKQLDEQCQAELKGLSEDLQFIRSCNLPGEFMSDDRLQRLREIGGKTFVCDNARQPWLTEDEIFNLSIRKGSLTDKERKVIENHAEMTHKILGQLPFPKNLVNVPRFAAAHHEKMDGTGYPGHLSHDDLPVQARIMAIADIFEALTARDRPYKKPMPLSQAVKIMGFMKKDHHIDPDLYDLFIDSRVYYEYARKEMNPDQIDE